MKNVIITLTEECKFEENLQKAIKSSGFGRSYEIEIKENLQKAIKSSGFGRSFHFEKCTANRKMP